MAGDYIVAGGKNGVMYCIGTVFGNGSDVGSDSSAFGNDAIDTGHDSDSLIGRRKKA